jgi:hypothetical protein
MKTHINNTMLLLLLLFCFSISFAQDKKEIKAKIKITQADSFISIFPTAYNSSSILQNNLSYSILALKKSATGNMSKNSQSGVFSIMPGETKILSSQKLNIDENGSIQIFLFIRRDDKVIAKDTLHVGAVEKKFKSTPLQETNFEIAGLIIENVLTKPGKDFYEFFSQINRSNGISYPFIIVSNDTPSLGGRNSVIDILIAHDSVFKFNTQPKEEYLQMAAKQANREIYTYYSKRKILYKNEKLF